MSDRDRLIELIEKSNCENCIKYDVCRYSKAFDPRNVWANGNCPKFKDESRFVELPCNVGDTVYYFSHRPFNLSLLPNTIYKADVVRIVTTRLGTSVVIQIHNDYGCTEVPQISDFGKTVFLTKEEAEEKLKELKDNA